MIQSIEKINPMLVKSRVKPKSLPVDIIEEEKEVTSDGKRKRLDYFYSLWLGLQTWRNDRMKWTKYYNSEQWHEKITDDRGNTVTEEEYISSQGKIPLKQNLIKPIFNSILGQYRSDRGKTVIISRIRDKAKESEMLSNALQSSLEYNDIREVDVASLIEKGISGLCIQRISYDYWPEDRRWDALVETVNPNFIFFNGDAQDPRWRDLTCIGRIIDTNYGKVLSSFGKTPEKARRIYEIYQNPDRYKQYGQNHDAFDEDRYYRLDFFMPDELSKCRVIEAWELKVKKVIIAHDLADGTQNEFDGTMEDIKYLNQYRRDKYMVAGIDPDEAPPIEAWEDYRERWYYGYYSPNGDILDEGETPYWHGSHPFVLPPNHMVDGKLTGLVYDLYDTQRQLNRLLALQDFILGTSSKNTLIVDEDSLNGQKIEDIASQYVKVGGVIALKLRDGAKLPIEIGKNVSNLGINEMIQMNMKFMQDISGVYPSLQGQQAQAGTPASRVITESQNSSLNLKQFLESFNTFRKDRNEKVLKVIQQFYNEPRWLAITGSKIESSMYYDPQRVKDLEFDLTIAQGADSPVYRNIIDETLKEFLMQGLIDIETYLSNTSMPYADTLLESIRNKKQEMQQGELSQQLPQTNTQSNPNAMALLEKGIYGR